MLNPFNAKRKIDGAPLPSQGPFEKFGVLQPQEVLLGLFGEYVDVHERAWSGALVQLLGDLGFSGPASRVALNRVIARGLLEPIKHGRFVFYKITPRLQVVHDEGRKQTFSQVPNVQWDGQWTIVWYNIPEKQRQQRGRLGRWLNLRGFGAIQDGTWVAPGCSTHEVLSLVKRLGLEKHIVVFLGSLADGMDIRQTVDRAWRVDDLKRMYDVFIKKFGPLEKPGAISMLSDREAFVARTRLIEMFRQTTMHDPRLPDDVLGTKWKRTQAIELFGSLQQSLLAQASTHFRDNAVTGAANEA